MVTTLKFSVVIPVYNIEKYLPACVNSVLNQTYPHLEIILVDDGSTDRSGALCDEFAARDPRVKVIHQANGGLVAARIAGIKLATGDYLTHVDGDDYVDERLYEKCATALQEHDVDVVMWSYTSIWQNKQEINHILSPGKIVYQGDLIYLPWNSAVWNKLVRRSLYQGQLEFYDPSLTSGEDLLLNFLVLRRAKSLFYLHEPLSYYRQRLSSITHHLGDNRIFTSFMRTFVDLEQLCVRDKELFHNLVRRFMGQVFVAFEKASTKIAKKNVRDQYFLRLLAIWYPSDFRSRVKYYLITHRMVRTFKFFLKKRHGKHGLFA